VNRSLHVLAMALALDVSTASAQFTDITDGSGVTTIVDVHYAANPDWWLSGIHFVDLDDDGKLDLFLSSHGGGDALAALGEGSGGFVVAPGSYPTTELHLSYDFDEDGKNDLTMTYVDGGGQWWKNFSAPGALDIRATDITRDGNTARTQVLADFNRDRRVDWLRAATPGIEFDLGDGNGGFATDSIAITIPNTDSNNNANIIPGDFDNDGDLDLLVMVGGGYDDTNGRTYYYRNDGIAGGVPQFSDQTAASGLPSDGLVVKGVGDYDLDGSLDLIGIQDKQLPPVVYRNTGDGVFTLIADAISGVVASDLTYAAWGTAVKADFDNDGMPDILMNGKYYLMLLRGIGGAHFEYMNDAWGITDVCPCSIDGGLAFGDIDGDGDLDIAGYANIDEPYQLKLYRNDNPAQHWLDVQLIGSHGNRSATGAKIRLFAPGTQQLVGDESVAIYCFQAAASYYGKALTERHFGLGARTSVDVEVEFDPSGRIVRQPAAAADSTIVIREDAEEIFANGFD
jgi:VCBS repeat protein